MPGIPARFPPAPPETSWICSRLPTTLAIALAAATLLLPFLCVSTAAAAAPTIDPDVPERGFFSLHPAPQWEEALLIGNGKMGGLVMGRPFDETVTLTHERLFLPIAPERPTVETASYLDEIRKLIRGGKPADAARLVMELDKQQGRPGQLVWTDPFFPACDVRITLDTAANAAAADYRRSLDYSTGVARVQWTDADTLYQQRSFISRPDNLMVLEFAVDGAKRLSGKIALEPRTPGPQADARELAAAARGPEKPTAQADGQWIVYRAGYRDHPAGYEVIARTIVLDGSSQAADSAIRFDGASKVLVLLRIVPLEDFTESAAAKARAEIEAAVGDFDAILRRHEAVHGKIYSRQQLDLGGAEGRRVPAEQLWQQTHDRAATPALLEQVFDAGRYQILCSTGDWPPNLQGVWTGVWRTPWMSDYTHNGNVPAAIGGLLNGNMAELMHSVFGYLEPMMEHFRSNARRHFGTRGIFIPSRTSRFGYDLSYNQEYPMTFWTAGAAWYASFYYDYHLFTGDEKFLLEKALPFMKEAALFYEDFLVRNADGVYEFNPSYSPENTPAGSTSQACINATMDVAACRKLLLNLIEACTRRGIEQENVAKWRSILDQLPGYMVGEDGALKEWCHPDLKDNHPHRHCSHFLGLWYGIDPAIAGDPALLAAAKKAVLLRADARRQAGGTMGFGAVQIGLAAASLADAETVWFILERLATRYYYPTFASSHDAGPRIFNADISGGLPAVMVEMLVQSGLGSITLLPALPRELPSGSVTGVPCRGQITVERLAWSPDSLEFTLSSPDEREVSVNYAFEGSRSTIQLVLRPNRPATVRLGKQ